MLALLFISLFSIGSCTTFHTPPYFEKKPSIENLYNSIDPLSIAKNFTFYELYPESPEGKKALLRAFELLKQDETHVFELPKLDLNAIVSLVNRKPLKPDDKIDLKQIQIIEKISENLANRRLKGNKVTTKKELLALSPDQVDISRALFLTENDFILDEKMRYYEASIDFMALQILARLSDNPTPEMKIRKINDFIFHEMRFRFPPHSLYAKNIDTYTFLPSVIDNRKGVCLGVSLLYLAIAQRLDLSLEAITPPGHIYVRHRDKKGDIINIETTNRGLNLPCETYLGIETRALQKRNYKETVGLAFMNEASVVWEKQDYKKAASLYEKASLFIPDDYLLSQLLGFCYLFSGKKAEGKKLLKKVKDVIPDYALSKNSMIQDYLSKKVNEKGIQAVFLHVDETRDSILAKRKQLKATIKKYPKFRSGLLQLASNYLQLSEAKSARKYLEKYIKIDPNEPIVNYYLSILAFENYDYNLAWHHLGKLESLLSNFNHKPRALSEYRKKLKRVCPRP